ncbi:MAG: hypothetical protein M9894_05855 [Planctomycetes bacterium]|nr:hypothetical protein [Planctomycetota bacterium]
MASAPARSPLDLLDAGASADLRDARLLAWLLDPKGEHGLGHAVLVTLGACMAEKGKKALSRILASPSPPPFETAVRLRAGQVEVSITTMGHEMVGVWRTRARGYAGELERYAAENVPTLGIGRTADAFPPETAAQFPILTWLDLLGVLDASGPPLDAPGAGAQLAVAFRERLRARLGPLAPAGRAPAASSQPPPPPSAPQPAPSSPPPAPPPASPTVTPAAATRRLARTTGVVPRPQLDPKIAAARLLEDAPALARHVPGAAPPPTTTPLAPREGTLLLSADRRRRYLVHRPLGAGREAEVVAVAIQGGDPFPGFEEEVETAALRVPRGGVEAAERERRLLARPHPGLVRLLAAEPGPPPGLVLERLSPHPHARFGRVDPATALNGFVNLLELVQGIHDDLGVILCSIEPGNLMLRMPADIEDAGYLGRLAWGAWEPVLIDVGAALGPAELGEGGQPPLVAGDPLYLPPEATPRFGKPGRYSRKTDTYALGLTLYEHLTGDRPYGRTDLHERQGVEYVAELLALKEKGTSPINGLLLHERFEADVAEDLLDILRCALAPDPAQRRTPGELLDHCRAPLRLAERRPAVPAAEYLYDGDLGLHIEQRRLACEE